MTATAKYLQATHACEHDINYCQKNMRIYSGILYTYNGKRGCALKKASTSREATWAS